MENFSLLSSKEEDVLSKEELYFYYNQLRENLLNQPFNDKLNIKIHKLYQKLSKLIRKYDIEIIGEENIPKDIPVIFACNHSNSHDFYTAQEFIPGMVSVFAAKDCLNSLSQQLFNLSGSVLIDRNDQNSCLEGTNKIVQKILNGNNAVIFPETTWNLSPSKPMLPIRWGCTKIAAKSDSIIIPTIFEYVENDKICKKEMDIYDKCIIQYGNPIIVKSSDNFLEKTNDLRNVMAETRINLWKKCYSNGNKNIDYDIYENHTKLKIDTLLYKHNLESENKFILGSTDYIYDNDYDKNYYINEIPNDYQKIKRK